MTEGRRHRRWAWALSVALLVGLALAWWLLPVLLEAAYAGRAGPLLNGLISGRDSHSLAFYAKQLNALLILATIGTLPTAALLGVLGLEGGPARLARGALRLAQVAPALLAVLAGGWLLLRIAGSLELPFFGDSAEKVVAAWMLAAGGRLYTDVYANHGPLSYLLAHVVQTLTGSWQMAPYRLAQWGLVVMAVAAVGASPTLSGWRQRLLAMGLLAFLIALLYPEWKAHEPLYGIHVGLFFAIALSLWLLPLLLRRPSPALAVAVGAAMMPLIIGAAYPFGVTLVLFGLGTALVLYSRGELREGLAATALPASIGITTTALLLLAWLIAFGDLPGYLVFHLYLNQAIYAEIIEFDPLQGLAQLARLADPRFGWALLVVLILPFWVLRQVPGDAALPASTARRIALACGMLLLVVGLLYLNPRNDSGFKVAALQVSAATLLAIMLGRGLAPAAGPVAGLWRQAGLITALLMSSLVIGLTTLTPFFGSLSEEFLQRRRHVAVVERIAARPLIERIDARLSPGEPIQVLTFLPRWYLLAGRLPASGQYYYLPAQAEYERTPISGYRMDLCADLAERQVEVVLLHDYPVHGSYRLEDYAPCIARLLASRYELSYRPDSVPDVPMPLLLTLRRLPSAPVSHGE